MTIQCLPCNKCFRSAQDIHKHLTSAIHGNGSKCDDCLQGTISWDQEAFLAHLKSHKHLLYCNDCGKSFKTKPDLKQHLKSPVHAKITVQPAATNRSSAPQASKAVAPRTIGKIPAFNSGSASHNPPSRTSVAITKSTGKQAIHSPRTASKSTAPVTKTRLAANQSTGKLPVLDSTTALSSTAHILAAKIVNRSTGKLPALDSTTTSNSTAPPLIGKLVNESSMKLLALKSGSLPSPSASLPPSNASNTGVSSFPWSTIHASESQAEKAFEELSKHCHTLEDLKKFNYRLSPYSALEIEGFHRCEICGERKIKTLSLRDSRCFFHPKKKQWQADSRKLLYLCCGRTGKGCLSNSSHNFIPNESNAKYRDLATCPPSNSATPKSRAVVLDCEMAGIKGGDSEVIQICAADYLTGEILLNKYVFPNVPITDWRSNIHGIKSTDVRNALKNGDALLGWEAARHELWNLIDDDTILIGHSLHYDLNVLRMIHSRIVDSALLIKNAINFGKRIWGLEALCHDLLDLGIRRNEGGIHDCAEDVFATREVVLWCVGHGRELGVWADARRREERRKGEEIERRRRIREERKGKGKVKRGVKMYDGFDGDEDDDEDEVEILRWEDIAVDLGWPHPDTGYDPWSD